MNLLHEALDLHQLSQDVLKMMELRASEAGITLEYERSMDEVKYPYVYGSSLHLRQIFLNIYSNSIKYSTLGGRITTKMRCVGVGNGIVRYQWTIVGIQISRRKATRDFREKEVDFLRNTC